MDVGCTVFWLTHTASAVVVFYVVAGIEVGKGNNSTGMGRVDKLTVAGINANVGNATLVCTLEEYDITGLQVFLGNIGALLVLISRCPVGGEAQSL